MRRLSILLLVLVSAVVSALAVVPATPAAAAVCKPFMVIGLRGSGQSVTAGPYQMGGVVDGLVDAALSRRDTFRPSRTLTHRTTTG